MSQSASIQDIPDLHLAIRKGLFHDIRCLVSSGDDVDVKDPADHRTPLMLCAMIEQEKWGVGVARMLLERGALVGYTDRRGLNALMYACVYGRAELVKVFLRAVDFDPNQRDRWGNTALFYAASNGNEEIVDAVISSLLHFKLPLDKANKWGMTPLLEACRCGHEGVVGKLEEHGVPTEVRDVILQWGMVEWRRDHEQRIVKEAPRSRSYDKPWLRTKDPQTKNLQRSTSSTSSRTSSDGLPSISNSRTSHRYDVEDDVFLSPTIIVSLTKSEPMIVEAPRNEPQTQKKLPSTATKRRMLFKPWIHDLTKDNVITAIFSPAPASSMCLSAHSAPTVSSSISLTKQRTKNKQNRQAEWSINDQYQQNFKQIFQRYEIQSSDSFRQRAKTPYNVKVSESQPDVDHLTPRHAHTSKLSRRHSRMDMNSNNRLSSTSSSLDMNSGRKSKAGDILRARVAERGKPEDSASSVSSEESSGARLMNAFRKRKTSVVPP